LEDIHLIEDLASFDRERISERVIHARDTGAYRKFASFADVSRYTKASLFQKVKTTPVFMRFSTVVHGVGSPETSRDPRGLATKFSPIRKIMILLAMTCQYSSSAMR